MTGKPYKPQPGGSPLVILRQLAGGPQHFADVMRLICHRHTTKNGMKEAVRSLVKAGLVRTQMLVITEDGVKALQEAEKP